MTRFMQVKVKRLLWGKFNNSGQICVDPDYVLCTKVNICRSLLSIMSRSHPGSGSQATSCHEESAERVLRGETRDVQRLLQDR